MKDELCNRIEAILFASGKGVEEKELGKLCNETPRKILNALNKLKDEYEKRECSLVVNESSKKWKLTVRGKYVIDIHKLVSETELPQATLKTLAIIAFKSPVLQSEIIDMRGQSAYEHIKLMVENGLVTKEHHGRSYILKITEKFYNYFDVEGDEEIRDVFAQLSESHNEKLGKLDVIDIPTETSTKNGQTTLEADNVQNKNKLGTLDIVDSNGNIQPQDVREKFSFELPEKTVLKTEEQKQDERDFLAKMDNKINNISERIASHELPEQSDVSENENSSLDDFSNDNTNNNDKNTDTNKSDNTNDNDKEKENNKTNTNNKFVDYSSQSDDDGNSLAKLEEFAENANKDDEEQFI